LADIDFSMKALFLEAAGNPFLEETSDRLYGSHAPHGNPASRWMKSNAAPTRSMGARRALNLRVIGER